MKALHELSVNELRIAMTEKQVSSVEVTTHLLARVSAYEHLGAWLCVDAEAALKQAATADLQRAQGSPHLNGALLGIPLAHKDIFRLEQQLRAY